MHYEYVLTKFLPAMRALLLKVLLFDRTNSILMK